MHSTLFMLCECQPKEPKKKISLISPIHITQMSPGLLHDDRAYLPSILPYIASGKQ
jgi:hypothetical protein